MSLPRPGVINNTNSTLNPVVDSLLFSRKGKNKNFYLAGIPYGMSTGIFAVWSGLLSINLQPYNVDEVRTCDFLQSLLRYCPVHIGLFHKMY